MSLPAPFPDTENCTDELLMARIGRHDEAALRTLLDKYSPHLCQFSISLLRRRDLAEEAVANVFIRIWLRRETLHIRESVRAYLFSAVSNQSLKMLRSQLRANVVSLDEVPAQLLVDEQGADSDLLYREFENEIESLLAVLPAQRRQIFRLHRLEKLRYQEIATLLGISVNRVQKHMVQASRQIAAALPAFTHRLNGERSQK